MLKETLQKVANASDTPIMQDKETQLQHWTNFVVNEVMPKVAPYASVDESIYTYERDKKDEDDEPVIHGNFGNPNLSQTEQLALLGADYALSQGLNPQSVIFGCVIKDFTEKYRHKNKWIDNKSVPRTQEDFIQDSKEFLEKHQFNLTNKDKEQIINAVFFPEKVENNAIVSCINNAIQTRNTWENNSSIEKEAYLAQQIRRLNKTDMPSYIQQHMAQGYTYENSPIVGTKEEPIVFYHSTPISLAKLAPVPTTAHGDGIKLYTSPDIRYTLFHIKKNKKAKNTTKKEFISINGSAQIDKAFYEKYLEQHKHMNTDEIKQHLKEHTSQSSTREVDTPPFIYKGELVGLFPLSDKSFKEQGIDLPMGCICRFMNIDYPIKDNKKFLKQTIKAMDEFEKANDIEYLQYYSNDLEKLKNFLKYVDISNGKSDLQEASRKPYVQQATNMLKTFIERHTPNSLTFLISEKGLNKNIANLIDGTKEAGFLNDPNNPAHYAIYNPDAVKVTARYKIEGYNIAKVEKPNAEGHFGAIEPPKIEQQNTEKRDITQNASTIPQQMVAETPQTVEAPNVPNRTSTSPKVEQQSASAPILPGQAIQTPSNQVVAPPKLPEQQKLTPEQLAKNIHRYM